jgi:hypothetical protein
MPKSATEVMQEIVFSAVLDAVAGLKTASKGVPNAMLRDLGAIHANTALADLPKELQAVIAESVRGAFARLQKEGYAIAPIGSAPPPRARPAGPPPRPRSGPLGDPRSGAGPRRGTRRP